MSVPGITDNFVYFALFDGPSGRAKWELLRKSPLYLVMVSLHNVNRDLMCLDFEEGIGEDALDVCNPYGIRVFRVVHERLIGEFRLYAMAAGSLGQMPRMNAEDVIVKTSDLRRIYRTVGGLPKPVKMTTLCNEKIAAAHPSRAFDSCLCQAVRALQSALPGSSAQGDLPYLSFNEQRAFLQLITFGPAATPLTAGQQRVLDTARRELEKAAELNRQRRDAVADFIQGPKWLLMRMPKGLFVGQVDLTVYADELCKSTGATLDHQGVWSVLPSYYRTLQQVPEPMRAQIQSRLALGRVHLETTYPSWRLSAEGVPMPEPGVSTKPPHVIAATGGLMWWYEAGLGWGYIFDV